MDFAGTQNCPPAVPLHRRSPTSAGPWPPTHDTQSDCSVTNQLPAASDTSDCSNSCIPWASSRPVSCWHHTSATLPSISFVHASSCTWHSDVPWGPVFFPTLLSPWVSGQTVRILTHICLSVTRWSIPSDLRLQTYRPICLQDSRDSSKPMLSKRLITSITTSHLAIILHLLCFWVSS